MLLPAAACCCLLLPAAACCCLLLPAAACCCLLLPAAACMTVDAALMCRFLMGRGGLNTSCEHGLAWLQRAAAAVVQDAETVSAIFESRHKLYMALHLCDAV
jgi:hypothetical protein